MKQRDIDAGTRPGSMTEESARLKALRKENAELKRANEILNAAASFLAAELDRCHTHARNVQRRAPKPLRRRRADLQNAHRAPLHERPRSGALNRQGREVARCTVSNA
ncbi:hypothetical protein [Streptomyces violaceorubidus]